jgi:hypothetical protein
MRCRIKLAQSEAMRCRKKRSDALSVRSKAAPDMPGPATATPGKSSFVKEFLNDNPQGNAAAVNEAWTAAGMDGTISTALVGKMRSEMGLTGNLCSGTRKPKAASGAEPYTGKKRGRKPKQSSREGNGATGGFQTHGRKGAGSQALLEVEAEIDRLLFKVMGIGALNDIEDALRATRRRLYGGFAAEH